MALLTFPFPATNGQVYPVSPPAGTNIYQWVSADQTWRLLGVSTGVSAGTYGTPLDVPQITVDSTGRITFVQNVAIQLGTTAQIGLVQLVDDTTTNDGTKALTAAQGYALQNQIGDLSLLVPPFTNLVSAINGTYAPTGVTAGTYGSGTQVGRFTVNAAGRITSATNVSLTEASTTAKGVVQIGSNISVTPTGIISVPNATGVVAGVAKIINNTTTNDSTSALTAAAGYNLQQQIDSLVIRNNLTFAGTISAVTGKMVEVSAEGAAAGFVTNSPLPSPSLANEEYFVVVSVAGTFTPTGGVPTSVNAGDWLVSDGANWVRYSTGVPYATTTAAGVVELSTNAETQAGANTTVAVTPASLQSKLSSSVASTSTTTIANSAAVKTAYDTAKAVQFRTYDDISGFFNGATLSFNLTISGAPVAPSPSTNIMVFIGGIAQTPGLSQAYTVSGSVITFTTAPPAGATFYATTVGAP